MIYRAREEALPWPVLQAHLDRLQQAAHRLDYVGVRAILLQVVKGYRPECAIQDWVFAEQVKSALVFATDAGGPAVDFQPARAALATVMPPSLETAGHLIQPQPPPSNPAFRPALGGLAPSQIPNSVLAKSSPLRVPLSTPATLTCTPVPAV
jgi:hypothetical protein